LINYYLTGQIATDYSYASGSGVYDLIDWKYSDELLAASGLPGDIFPEIYPSTTVIGSLTDEAAGILGLPNTVKVVAGGVDNSCMALGARNIKEGRIYESQGSSSWIAVTSAHPLLDLNSRPFVFTHVIPELFTSATGAFSTGSSFRWVRDNLCRYLMEEELELERSIYDQMTSLASQSNVGANGLLFNPNLAGGSSLHDSPNIRGAFLGIDLGHTLSDILRATMEGVALETRLILDALRKLTPISEEMIVVGGGGRSKLWRQIHADVYNLRIIKTNIDQQAAALGAAALAAVGSGFWDDFGIIDEIHKIEDVTEPIPENNAKYEKLLEIYLQADKYLSDIGERVKALNF
jgi:xylulokinase